MKRYLLVVVATVLLVAPCRSRAQSVQPQDEMTVPELRQVLTDFGGYLDEHKGTNLRSHFEQSSDESLRTILPAIQNPRGLKKAVAALLRLDARKRASQAQSARSNFNVVAPLIIYTSCPPNSIIDDSPAPCNPGYPDPTDSHWQAEVSPLFPFGAFTGLDGSFPYSQADYNAVSPQGCSLDEETLLSTLSSAFQGTVEAASNLCAALPPIASNVCFGINTGIATAGAVTFGLFSDCVEQDGLVNSAKIDAGFHNTVTIYNALINADNQLTTQINNVNNQITGEFGAIDTHLTNVDNHTTAQFNALNVELLQLFTQLTNQLTQSSALLNADLKQVMKLAMTPDGLRVIAPAILTCTGTNCPNVLAHCPAAGCSWNNVGPLP